MNKTTNENKPTSSKFSLKRWLAVIKSFAKGWLYPITALVMIMSVGQFHAEVSMSFLIELLIGSVVTVAALFLLKASYLKTDYKDSKNK